MDNGSKKQIKDIRVGNKVQSIDSGDHIVLDTVVNKVSTGTKQCLLIKLNNGQEITASLDHRLRSSVGWVEARNLRPGDKLAVAINHLDQSDKHFFLVDFYTTYCRTQDSFENIPVEVFTSSNREIRLFIGWLFSSNGSCGRSPNLYSYTSDYKRCCLDLQLLLYRLGISSSVCHNPLSGNHQLFIYTPRDIIQFNEQIYVFGKQPEFKKVAVNILNDGYQPTAATTDITWSSIINIQECEADTYDIETEVTHNFIADGIISHNSTAIAHLYPIWLMGRALMEGHSETIGVFTYGQELSNDNSYKARQFFNSNYFKLVFPAAKIVSENIKKWRLESDYDISYTASSVGGVGTGRGYSCLPAGTLVSCENNSKDISEIRSGEWVLAYNHTKGTVEVKQVLQTKISLTAELYKITTTLGGIVSATEDHRFYTNCGYICANNLLVGDVILEITAAGIKEDTISSIERISCGTQRVYDIQVEGCHNFFANQILVHNCLIIDDPHKDWEETRNHDLTDKVYEWYQSVAYTGIEKGGKLIVLATRWCDHDLTAHILDTEDWEYLNMPAINEAGEALWPEQFDLDRLADIREHAGTKVWQCLYQQNPLPDEGKLFKKEYIRYGNPDRRYLKKIISWDTASTMSKSSDYSVGVELGLDEQHNIYIIDVIRLKVEFTELVKTINSWGTADTVYIEEKASGIQVMQVLRQEDSRRSFIGKKPKLSKEARADFMSPLFEAGKIFFTRPFPDLEKELLQFPDGAHDDCIDALSQGVYCFPKGDIHTAVPRDEIIKSSPYRNIF